MKTHFRDDQERYAVRLPFDQNQIKSQPRHFKGAYTRAHTVLRPLKNKLKNETFRDNYYKFIHEYQKLSHMSLVTPLNTGQRNSAFHLPHHGVLSS